MAILSCSETHEHVPFWAMLKIKNNDDVIHGGNIMKQKLLIAAAASALMAAPSIASAQDQDSGWYLRGNAGYGVHADTELSDGIVGDVESEGNVAGSIGVGYEFGNNWRLELDGAQLFTDLGAVGQTPSSFAKLRTTSLMLNAIQQVKASFVIQLVQVLKALHLRVTVLSKVRILVWVGSFLLVLVMPLQII